MSTNVRLHKNILIQWMIKRFWSLCKNTNPESIWLLRFLMEQKSPIFIEWQKWQDYQNPDKSGFMTE